MTRAHHIEGLGSESTYSGIQRPLCHGSGPVPPIAFAICRATSKSLRYPKVQRSSPWLHRNPSETGRAEALGSPSRFCRSCIRARTVALVAACSRSRSLLRWKHSKPYPSHRLRSSGCSETAKIDLPFSGAWKTLRTWFPTLRRSDFIGPIFVIQREELKSRCRPISDPNRVA